MGARLCPPSEAQYDDRLHRSRGCGKCRGPLQSRGQGTEARTDRGRENRTHGTTPDGLVWRRGNGGLRRAAAAGLAPAAFRPLARSALNRGPCGVASRAGRASGETHLCAGSQGTSRSASRAVRTVGSHRPCGSADCRGQAIAFPRGHSGRGPSSVVRPAAIAAGKMARWLLWHRLAAAAFRVHATLAGNGIRFAEPQWDLNAVSCRPLRSDMFREAKGIERRPTVPTRARTNGEVEMMHRAHKHTAPSGKDQFQTQRVAEAPRRRPRGQEPWAEDDGHRRSRALRPYPQGPDFGAGSTSLPRSAGCRG